MDSAKEREMGDALSGTFGLGDEGAAARDEVVGEVVGLTEGKKEDREGKGSASAKGAPADGYLTL